MNTKQKEILKNLSSPIEKDVLKALTDVKQHGSAAMIPAIMKHIMEEEESTEASDKAKEVLSSLKDSEAQNAYLDELIKPEYQEKSATYLGLIWQAGIKAENHVSNLVKCALKGDFNSVFEVITIIENSENEIPEPEILESQIACKLYLDNNAKSQKKEIVENLLQLLDQTDTYN
ncbi:hypothetical protein [Luteibaculum oceani]|uniref:HEAT repeat domain-containing protein n=1 Tax=Luteibaculum oceani TaxID=1294296 RepID=A0A5C6V972_9FLAO|nr:hypothetical protein [Luteibaculum oceani]TXC81973.1 hypothetical protein FRX97_02465 [Luteibaculum oceani]